MFSGLLLANFCHRFGSGKNGQKLSCFVVVSGQISPRICFFCGCSCIFCQTVLLVAGLFWQTVVEIFSFWVFLANFLPNSFIVIVVLAQSRPNVFSLVLAIKISEFLSLAVPKISIFRVVLANVVKCLQFVKFFWPPFSPPKCSSCQVVILRV